MSRIACNRQQVAGIKGEEKLALGFHSSKETRQTQYSLYRHV